MVYEGTHVNDLKNGPGKYITPDGAIIEVNYYHGVLTGQVTLINKRGEKVYDSPIEEMRGWRNVVGGELTSHRAWVPSGSKSFE